MCSAPLTDTGINVELNFINFKHTCKTYFIPNNNLSKFLFKIVFYTILKQPYQDSSNHYIIISCLYNKTLLKPCS